MMREIKDYLFSQCIRTLRTIPKASEHKRNTCTLKSVDSFKLRGLGIRLRGVSNKTDFILNTLKKIIQIINYFIGQNIYLDLSTSMINMDPRVPERFLSTASKAKGITTSRIKTNKLQRQQRCPSIDASRIPSCAIENLLLSLQMYLTSARLVTRLADEYYDSVDNLLTEEDRDNLVKIVELRHLVKNEVNDLDQYLQNILNKLATSPSSMTTILTSATRTNNFHRS